MIVSTWRGKGLTQVGSCFPTSKKEVYLVYINLETDMMYLHGAVLFVGKLTYTKEGGYDMVAYILEIMWFIHDISDIYNFSSKCPWHDSSGCDLPCFFPHDDQANKAACTKKWRKMEGAQIMHPDALFQHNTIGFGEPFHKLGHMIVIDGVRNPWWLALQMGSGGVISPYL